jgi:hypothetical protein
VCRAKRNSGMQACRKRVMLATPIQALLAINRPCMCTHAAGGLSVQMVGVEALYETSMNMYRDWRNVCTEAANDWMLLGLLQFCFREGHMSSTG